MSKNFVLLSLAAFLLFIVNSLSVSAEDTQCNKLFTNNCQECHELQRGCELLGQSEKEWVELFDFMEDMGADLPDDEKTTLLECLNNQDDGIKATCKEEMGSS